MEFDIKTFTTTFTEDELIEMYPDFDEIMEKFKKAVENIPDDSLINLTPDEQYCRKSVAALLTTDNSGDYMYNKKITHIHNFMFNPIPDCFRYNVLEDPQLAKVIKAVFPKLF